MKMVPSNLIWRRLSNGVNYWFYDVISAILSFVENNNINYCFSAFNTNTQVLPIFSPSKNTQEYGMNSILLIFIQV